MSQNTSTANCDLVLEMEEAGVGVEEILQYARGVLADGEIHALLSGLAKIVDASSPSNDDSAEEIGPPAKELEPCLELRELALR